MRYVLAIGIETEIYKNPSLEVFLNDRFLGMTDLDQSVPIEIQKHKQHDIISSWGMVVKKPEKIHNILVPKKWIIYEIEGNELQNKNYLDLQFKNLSTNVTNGFMNKLDRCKIVKVIFVPKKWFGPDHIQNIVDHCDGKNIIIDTGGASLPGWPSAPYPLVDNPGDMENDIAPAHVPILNANASFEIVYDEILDLHRIEADKTRPNGGNIHAKIKEISLEDDYIHREDYKFIAKQPQKPFKNNDETSVLNTDKTIKVYLQQISAKYQHNED